MRRSEIHNLNWSQSAHKTGFIGLRAEDTKEGKPKLIPINKNVVQALDEIVPVLRSDYVFSRKGKPLNDVDSDISAV